MQHFQWHTCNIYCYYYIDFLEINQVYKNTVIRNNSCTYAHTQPLSKALALIFLLREHQRDVHPEIYSGLYIMQIMKGINVKEHTHSHSHKHLCVVEEGVFLQGHFDLLMFGAPSTCQHVCLFTNCQCTTSCFFTHILVPEPTCFTSFSINTIFRELQSNYDSFTTYQMFTHTYYLSVKTVVFSQIHHFLYQ